MTEIVLPVTLVAQLIGFSFWLGKLSQKVSSLEKYMRETKEAFCPSHIKVIEALTRLDERHEMEKG
jgi:hypothetical protein